MENVWTARKNGLLSYMKNNGIDTALITSPTNVFYFTGFHCNPHERFLCLAIDVNGGSDALFVPLLDSSEARSSEGFAGEVIAVSDTDNPYELLAKRLEGKIGTIAVEKGMLSLAASEKIGAAAGVQAFADIGPHLSVMRMKKSEDEIAKVRVAISTIEQVVGYAAKHAAVGMTESELTAELEYQMRKLGADRPAFESIVLAGARSALPHGKPGNYAIRQGDFVLIDIGVQVNGYCSDITRTFVMGEASTEQKRIYDAVLSANMAAIEASRAGIPLSSIDKAARDVIAGRGYGELFTHRVGHGFGMDVHELPSISGDNGMIAEPGLLYTIEPGIYDPAAGGVRIEDDVYIKADGNVEVLTSYPKQLIAIG